MTPKWNIIMTKYIAKKPDESGYIHFTAEENETWKILIERQLEVVKNRACKEFIHGLEKLNLPLDRIPQCQEISAVLQQCTGFSVVPVSAIIPLKEFFRLLANRQFPAASFIRIREELDYLQEPDIFHEYFGHCPLLTDPSYADFVQWYGETALNADKHTRSILGRLFWFTIEFGLVQTENGLRIYGGGILSSFSETKYALESEIPQRNAFKLAKILNTHYRYDEIQKEYFVLENLSHLFKIKEQPILKISQAILDGNLSDEDFVIC